MKFVSYGTADGLPQGTAHCVLQDRTDVPGALAVAEELRSRVEGLNIVHEVGRVTISLGAATDVPSDRYSPARLIEAADRALCTAKREGRNRVRFAVEAIAGDQWRVGGDRA